MICYATAGTNDGLSSIPFLSPFFSKLHWQGKGPSIIRLQLGTRVWAIEIRISLSINAEELLYSAPSAWLQMIVEPEKGRFGKANLAFISINGLGNIPNSWNTQTSSYYSPAVAGGQQEPIYRGILAKVFINKHEKAQEKELFGFQSIRHSYFIAAFSSN